MPKVYAVNDSKMETTKGHSMSQHQYEVGDVIVYSPFGGGERTLLVETKEADVKNGRPGFSGRMVKRYGSVWVPQGYEFGDGVWGYDSQIVRTESRGVVA